MLGGPGPHRKHLSSRCSGRSLPWFGEVYRHFLPEQPILAFATATGFRQWLARHHADYSGLGLKIAWNPSGILTVNYAEALDEALCGGWIDGQKKSCNETVFLQKSTP